MMRVSGALRHIEHLASLRLCSQIVVPEMLRSLSGVLPPARADFCWLDRDGTVSDAYGTDHVRPGTAAWSDRGRALLTGDGSGELQLTIRSGQRPSAILRLRPHRAAKTFGERERSLLRSSEGAFRRALENDPVSEAPCNEFAEQTATILIAPDGRIISCDAAAPILMREMEGRRIAMSMDTHQPPKPGPILREFVRSTVRSRHLHGAVQTVSPWGTYRVRAFQQLGADGVIVVVLAKHLPRSISLLRRLSELGLSPRERHVAFELANGVEADHGARALGISISTWRSYVKRVYQRVEVNDRYGLLTALNAIEGAAYACRT